MSKRNLLSWKLGKAFVEKELRLQGVPLNLFDKINKSNRKYSKLRIALLLYLYYWIDCSISEIKELLGYADHTAIIHHLKRMRAAQCGLEK